MTKMWNVCFQENVLTDSYEEHCHSAASSLFTLEEPGDIDTVFVNTQGNLMEKKPSDPQQSPY